MAKLAPSLPFLGRSEAPVSQIPPVAVISQPGSGFVSNFVQAEEVVVESAEENGRKRRRNQVRPIAMSNFQFNCGGLK